MVRPLSVKMIHANDVPAKWLANAGTPRRSPDFHLFEQLAQMGGSGPHFRGRWFSVRLMSALGQSATSAGHASVSERSPEADIELSCVNFAL